MEEKVKIAVVGLGFIGAAHFQAIELSECVELCAAVDMQEERRREFEERYGRPCFASVEELLERSDCEIVDICVPTWLHESIAVAAARAGRHVLCEKPVSFTVESFDRMAEAAQQANVQFMVAQVLRFWPEYQEIERLYRENRFGTVKQVTMRRLCEKPNWAAWYEDPQKSGGALFDLILHDIDFAQYLFGDVARVYATGAKSPTGCWNHLSVNLAFCGGFSATIESSNEGFGGMPYTMAMRIMGSDMIADYELKAGHNIDEIGTRTLYTYHREQGSMLLDVERKDAYQNEIDAFAQAVRSGQECPCATVQSLRRTLELVLAVKQSLETEAAVEL